MWTYVTALLISTFASLLLTPLVRDWALARSMVDAPGGRKQHDAPVPRLGGLAIAVSFAIPIGSLAFIDNLVSQALYANPGRIIALGVGSALALTLGVIDDLSDMRAVVKLAAQVALASFAWACGYEIAIIANPMGAPIELGLLSFPVTVLWIVGIMNAINLIDGLDGLASGVALFSVVTLFVLGLLTNNVIVGVTSIALAGALLGFLRYNFNPASIFMGDGGSLFIGYVLAITAIWGSTKSSTVVSLLIPLLALGLPIADTALAFIRRVLAGRSPFSADRGHLHHRLLDAGFGHRQAVLALYGACAVLAAASLSLVFANSEQAAMILIMLAVVATVAAQALGIFQWSHIEDAIRNGLRRQTRLRNHLSQIREVGDAMQAATTPMSAAEPLDALIHGRCIDGYRLKAVVIRGKDGEVNRVARTLGSVAGTAPQVARTFDLDWGRGSCEVTGELTLTWNASNQALQLPEELGYEWLAVVLRDHILKLSEADNVVRLADAGP